MPDKNFRSPSYNQGKKVKVSQEQVSPEKRVDYPIFCFKHLHPPHAVSDCSDEEKSALIEQLCRLSQFTWAEIALMPRKGMGAEKISINAIKVGKPSFITEEVKFLLSFRFSGNKPFLGHQDGPLLHLIYIDSKFSVYDHGS